METPNPKPQTQEVPKPKKATTKPKPQTQEKETGYTSGKYQENSSKFFTKFPEVKALAIRLEKEGYGSMRFEITFSPKSKPSSKVVNIMKHNAPDTWTK